MADIAIVHLVTGASLRAACGKQLGLNDGHTGHWFGVVTFAAERGEPHCPRCLDVERGQS